MLTRGHESLGDHLTNIAAPGPLPALDTGQTGPHSAAVTRDRWFAFGNLRYRFGIEDTFGSALTAKIHEIYLVETKDCLPGLGPDLGAIVVALRCLGTPDSSIDMMSVRRYWYLPSKALRRCTSAFK